MLLKLKMVFEKYKHIVLYIFFGGITFLVNSAVYFPLYNLLNCSATLSNSISWAAAVITAFLTNKPFVFKSNDWSLNVTIPEFLKFAGFRLASGIAETAILFICVDLLCWDGNIWKIITSVAVVIVNYFASKLLVFKRHKEK